jgi:cyanophycin synthetase
MKNIVVTGTKGKTSVVNLVNFYLKKKYNKVVKINSNGIFVDENNIYSNDYFLKNNKTSANVVGVEKFFEERKNTNYNFFCLEASYSTNKYLDKSSLKNNIDFSCLTNIYGDHIGGNVKNRKELMEAKFNIISNTKDGGVSVVGIDTGRDDVSYKILEENFMFSLIFYGFEGDDLLEKLADEGRPCFFINQKEFYFRKNNKKVVIANFSDFPITFDGLAGYICKNLVAATCLLYGIEDGNFNKIDISKFILVCDVLKKIENNSVFNPGRLNRFDINGINVYLDFAHEENSINDTIELLKKFHKKDDIIGVIRLSYYRKLEYIKKLTKKISNKFSKLYIYDKAVSREQEIKKVFLNKYGYKEGQVADLMEKVASKEIGAKRVKKVYNEFEAIKTAINDSEKGDVILFIGDQLEKDMEILEKIN